jgi:phospholipid/cholesterol/gamma-HCH transport system substrate-binding protein
MKEQAVNKIRLGAFVLMGTVLLVLGLYYIGRKENIFSSSIGAIAEFKDVQGLMKGNNVRFNGINVGTVSKVYPLADTIIRVEFTIDENTAGFIGKDAVISIGTDGLLGNKLLNISPGLSSKPAIADGDQLRSLNPVEMESAMQSLNITNENIRKISENLRGITDKFNDDNSLWQLLADSTIASNVRSAVISFQLTGQNTAVVSGDLSRIVSDIKAGKGTAGALLTDTLIYNRINQTVINIEAVSDTMAIISGDFRHISKDIREGKGAIGTLLTDTTFVSDLNTSMSNIRIASGSFNEHLEALKQSWPFKKYYKRQEKNKMP